MSAPALKIKDIDGEKCLVYLHTNQPNQVEKFLKIWNKIDVEYITEYDTYFKLNYVSEPWMKGRIYKFEVQKDSKMGRDVNRFMRYRKLKKIGLL